MLHHHPFGLKKDAAAAFFRFSAWMCSAEGRPAEIR